MDFANLSATTQALGSSIMVPTLYFILTPDFLIKFFATLSMVSLRTLASSTLPSTGISISGSALPPLLLIFIAARMIASTCISVISG